MIYAAYVFIYTTIGLILVGAGDDGELKPIGVVLVAMVWPIVLVSMSLYPAYLLGTLIRKAMKDYQ